MKKLVNNGEKIYLSVCLWLFGHTVYGQTSGGIDFKDANSKIEEFVKSAATFINVLLGAFCLWKIVMIVIAYFGSNEESRQNVGGKVAQLVFGIVAFTLIYLIPDAIFGTQFKN